MVAHHATGQLVEASGVGGVGGPAQALGELLQLAGERVQVAVHGDGVLAHSVRLVAQRVLRRHEADVADRAAARHATPAVRPAQRADALLAKVSAVDVLLAVAVEHELRYHLADRIVLAVLRLGGPDGYFGGGLRMPRGGDGGVGSFSGGRRTGDGGGGRGGGGARSSVLGGCEGGNGARGGGSGFRAVGDSGDVGVCEAGHLGGGGGGVGGEVARDLLGGSGRGGGARFLYLRCLLHAGEVLWCLCSRRVPGGIFK